VGLIQSTKAPKGKGASRSLRGIASRAALCLPEWSKDSWSHWQSQGCKPDDAAFEENLKGMLARLPKV